MHINSVDFIPALHHVRPSVQRGSDVFLTNMPRISWSDIGGLDDVKQKLKQVLLLANVELLIYLLFSEIKFSYTLYNQFK